MLWNRRFRSGMWSRQICTNYYAIMLGLAKIPDDCLQDLLNLCHEKLDAEVQRGVLYEFIVRDFILRRRQIVLMSKVVSIEEEWNQLFHLAADESIKEWWLDGKAKVVLDWTFCGHNFKCGRKIGVAADKTLRLHKARPAAFSIRHLNNRWYIMSCLWKACDIKTMKPWLLLW